MRFTDRVEAGRLLGERLRDEELEDPVVLGLPRGGVVVAAEVADLLVAGRCELVVVHADRVEVVVLAEADDHVDLAPKLHRGR